MKNSRFCQLDLVFIAEKRPKNKPALICLIAGSTAPETTDDAVDATAKTPSAAAAAPPGSAAVPNVSRRNDDSPWTAAGSWRNEPASATTDGSPTAGLGN